VAVLLAAGVLTIRAVLSEPTTPPEVARDVVDAHFDQDWAEVWGLLCREDQAHVGPRESFARDRTEAAGPMASVTVDVEVTVREVRPDDAATSSTVVLELSRGDRSRTVELTVVQESDGYRVCGLY
jgi:hypothetical protein